MAVVMPDFLYEERRFQLVIIGGGPAGIAPLLAAHHAGQLDDLLSAGVAIVERSGALGAGTIGHYAINSDSSGATFVDCLRSPVPTPLTALYDHPLAKSLAAAGDGAVPLRDAGRFLALVGAALEAMVRDDAGCAVLTRHTACHVRRDRDGWRVTVRDEHGNQRVLHARNVVLATGGHQPEERLAAERVGGATLVDLCGDRLVQSGDVLGLGGLQRMADRLSGLDDPRVAVVGGSTSAAAVCHALLNRMPTVRFKAGGITLLHRRPLRIYYPDAQSALAEGYTEFDEDDICGISGKVFRFAGFRLDSRELIMQARGIGGRAPEPRLALHCLQRSADPQTLDSQALDPHALGILDRADIVVAAFGYRPRALPVMDMDGTPVRLLSQTGPQQPLVDGQCRVLDGAGTALPNLFGIGLSAGFVPRGALGGEPSFRGQANGLWLWQKDVGGLIVDAVRRPPKPTSRQPLQENVDAWS
ncbi:FAD-dependent oxidoreductase [Nguyenibacter vanlangensis]|uniref:FAD-dependent oxidoreductase n=2 Tax=Nguyenibacter vanlangensis TaxID=1216886 RepID=A0A7Y7IVD4_9PROT|nr:FAD-dependent oxidoreductase [Nguyenibacter vanlangensis]